MKYISALMSVLGLCLTVVPSFLVFYDVMSWRLHTQLMFAGMLLWFVFAPVWMRKQNTADG